MPQSSDITDLLHRFVDDRDGLEEQEYAQLAAAAQASPELIEQLRDQLLIDEALSQRLAIDRRHFDAQVQQRIADHLHGEDELNQQADELRSLAMAGLGSPGVERRSNWSTVVAWSSALLVLIAVGLSVRVWQQSQQVALLATVAEVEGQVIVHRVPSNNDEFAQAGLALQLGDRLSLADDANVTLVWPDGTCVQLRDGAVIDLPATMTGKRVYLDRGELAARVARQPASQPMIFATAHADAIVRGTELYLRVVGDDTHLEVAEGQVELIERQTSDSQLVESSQSATASEGNKVVRNSIRWPTSQRGLVYVFAGGQRPPLVRRNLLLRPSRLESHGEGEAFTSQGEMELSGRWFEDNVAASEVAAQLLASREFTIEAVVTVPLADDDQTRTVFALQSDQEPILALRQQGLNILEFVLPALPDQPLVFTQAGVPQERLHLLLTFANGIATAYVDGLKVKSARRNGALSGDTNLRLVFGGAEPPHWQGRIAGVAIYDRVLSDDEIKRNADGRSKE